MSTHSRTLPVVAGASSIAMLAAILSLPWGSIATTIEPAAPVAGQKVAHAPGPARPSADFAADALHDMRFHAALYLGVYAEIPDSFGGTPQWSPDWYLQWIDVEQDGVVVRVYHATNVRAPHHRFVTMWLGDQAEWEHAH